MRYDVQIPDRLAYIEEYWWEDEDGSIDEVWGYVLSEKFEEWVSQHTKGYVDYPDIYHSYIEIEFKNPEDQKKFEETWLK